MAASSANERGANRVLRGTNDGRHEPPGSPPRQDRLAHATPRHPREERVTRPCRWRFVVAFVQWRSACESHCRLACAFPSYPRLPLLHPSQRLPGDRRLPPTVRFDLQTTAVAGSRKTGTAAAQCSLDIDARGFLQ